MNKPFSYIAERRVVVKSWLYGLFVSTPDYFAHLLLGC